MAAAMACTRGLMICSPMSLMSRDISFIDSTKSDPYGLSKVSVSYCSLTSVAAYVWLRRTVPGSGLRMRWLSPCWRPLLPKLLECFWSKTLTASVCVTK